MTVPPGKRDALIRRKLAEKGYEMTPADLAAARQSTLDKMNAALVNSGHPPFPSYDHLMRFCRKHGLGLDQASRGGGGEGA